MATYNEHITQAKHNEEIAKFLCFPKVSSVGWVIIISFYAALQYLEAAFYNTTIGHSENHSKSNKSPHLVRQDLIQLDIRTKYIYDDYIELRRASETFRYLKSDISYFKNESAIKLLNTNLKNIKESLSAKKLITIP